MIYDSRSDRWKNGACFATCNLATSAVLLVHRVSASGASRFPSAKKSCRKPRAGKSLSQRVSSGFSLLVTFQPRNRQVGFPQCLINIIFLLLTSSNHLPTKKCGFQVRGLSKDWASRAALPGHVVTMLNNFPSNVHPMSQLVAACSALNSESKFAKAYSEGTHKSKYWEVCPRFYCVYL